MNGIEVFTMTGTETALSVVGAVVVLLITAAGIWATLTSATREAQMKQLTNDNVYMRGQLEFIEPRFKDAEAKTEMLMRLHNPTSKLDEMSEMEAANHAETVRLLGEQHATLEQIRAKVSKDD